MGASGCGKSTVMQLIQRFYDLPEDGGEVRDAEVEGVIDLYLHFVDLRCTF